MDFRIPDEVQQVLIALRRFLEREVLAVEERHRDLVADGRVSPEVMELGAEIRRKSVEAGFYNLHMPAEVGGGGLSHVALCLVREAIAGSGSKILGLFVLGDPPMGPTPMLLDCTPEQRERYLVPLMRGEKTTCFALTEPNAGSDVGAIETTAVRDGDCYVLNGSKHYISNGLYCDFIQAFVATERGKGIGGGISLLLVDADTPGVSRRLMRSMAGDDFQAEIVFEDCRVPVANLVGAEGYGILGAMKWLSGERLMMASQAIGLADYCLRLGVEYAKVRKAFGQTIGRFQGVSFQLADCATELDAARWMTYHTAWLLDQGEAAMQELAMAKLFASEVCGRIVDRVLQVHGGAAYMVDHPIERLYRVARVLRIGGGTSEIQRRLIAKGLGL